MLVGCCHARSTIAVNITAMRTSLASHPHHVSFFYM